jgi:hypothetical protein
MTRIGSGNAQGAVTGRELSGLRPLVAARPRLHSNRCHPQPGLGGENGPIFLDISDCCKTSSALGERWSRTRSEAGPSRVQAATHASRHPGRDRSRLNRGLASLARPWLAGENEPIFYNISDCCKTSSAAAERWSRTRSEAGPSRVHASTQAGRQPGRDRSRLHRGLASHERHSLAGENEPIFLNISDCCETSSTSQVMWSRTRSEAGPSRVHASTQAGRHPGRDRSRLARGLASLVRPGVRGQNEAIFLNISDCCETSSTSQVMWSRTRSEAGPSRVHAATQAGRHPGRDRSRLARGLASLVRPGLGGENEPIFRDISDCCEMSSTSQARWSRTRPEAGPKRAQAATQQEGRDRRSARSGGGAGGQVPAAKNWANGGPARVHPGARDRKWFQ